MKRARGYLTPHIRRRALVLLSSCPDGCTKAVLAAHDISDEIVRRLVRNGFAVARSDPLEQMGRVWLTDAGKRLLSARG